MSQLLSKPSRSAFHQTFYVANGMEILERFAWYGMYTLLALYLTSPIEQGGLGLAQSEKGLIMGVVPFFLYLFPIVSGALADRYGYRKMFIISFSIMAPCYYLLGHIQDMWTFMAVFMMVAMGAGIFKPIVTGTIGRTTDATNRGLGFGIFYMMVNIGGALGPLIAPIIQKKLGWDWVFTFAAIWIALNFIPVLFFYKEPVTQASNKSFKLVLQEMQLVLGNGRLALLIFPLLIILVAYNANLIPAVADISSDLMTAAIVILLLVVSVAWDLLNKNIQHQPGNVMPWYKQTMKVGNKPFMVYLLIMSGFWTVYLQLFITLPSYVRDFVDTSDLVSALQTLGPWFYDTFAGVDFDSLTREIMRLAQVTSAGVEPMTTSTAHAAIASLDIKVPLPELENALQQVANASKTPEYFAAAWAQDYRQVNPSTLLGLDFLMIVFCQLFISSLINRWQVLPTLIAGTAIVSAGLWLGGLAHGVVLGGSLVATSILIFATGEMIASPKSQEYVASFAPPDKVAMFMGYYFVSLALGNLFGGLLSGWLYETFAIGLNQPMMMWSIIAMLGACTCMALLVFSKTMQKDLQAQQVVTEKLMSEQSLTQQSLIQKSRVKNKKADACYD